MQTSTRIALSEPSLAGNEARYLSQCVEENWFAAKGRFVHELESLFARLHGRADAVSTASGTAALHLAMVALGLGPGDEVLVPALTFVASANAVRYTGATPVIVDVDPVTFTLDPAYAAGAVTERTRAMVVVHLFGHPADMDPLCALAREHDLAIVEDAAQALGSSYRGRACGTIGDVGCFSFNGNKIVTAGGGGMILAGDPDRLEHIRHLSFQGREPGTREYLHDEVGFNYALSNLHAAIGLAQLERLEELLSRRRSIALRYAEALDRTDDLEFSPEEPWARSNFWLMSVLVDSARHGRSREQLAQALEHAGIEARPFFTPIADLAAYDSGAAVPVARRLHRDGLLIPSSSGLTGAEQERVLAELLDFA
ncbi:MAG TPA: aminotransferase class I/II-fold pyridoxal phosphate-dependent enzyme [Solirubrobacteraceae bacterium]|jgi:perosamine synthetase|nr:aminotransferase class I/II-fold pyridoxal phosphate-dependent enzyme [Solirubrobacteraceae bacterium]